MKLPDWIPIDQNKVAAMPPPPGHPFGVFYAHPGKENSFLAIGIILIVLSFFVVSGRLYLNSINKGRRLGWDDIFCALGWLTTSAYAATWMSVRQYFRPSYDIPLSWYDGRIIKITFAGIILMSPSQFFVKGSFIILYYRIFSPERWVRILLKVLMVFSFVVYWYNCVWIPIICTPKVGEDWDPLNIPKCTQARLSGPIQGSLNCFIDLILFFLPLAVVHKLKQTKKRKLQIMAIFMTGVLAVIASLVGLAYRILAWNAPNGERDPFTHDYELNLCVMFELFISIICASMPAYATFSKQHISPRLSKLRGLFPSLSLRLLSSSRSSGRPHKTKIPHVQTQPPVIGSLHFGSEEVVSASRITGRGYLERGYAGSDGGARRDKSGERRGEERRVKRAEKKGGEVVVETEVTVSSEGTMTEKQPRDAV